jgi:iron complex transport system substrate-binding protein
MRTATLYLLLALPALILGCAEHSPAPPARQPPADGLHDWVSDPAVVAEERHSPPLRLLSLAPSATEICCALGLRAQVVGRTRFCDYPPQVRSLPQVGDVDTIDPEILLSLRPDLVFVSGASRAITDRLTRLGLRFESLPDRNLEDVFASIERVGRLTGRPRTAANLQAALRRELDQIAAAYATAPPQRVLILLAPLADPPAPAFAGGPGSFYDDLLHRAGHLNALAAEGRAYGPLALEAILRIDPDIIIELDADGTGRPGGDAEALRAWATLGNLKAVTNHHVHVLTGRQHHIPGPRIVQAFAELCRTIAGKETAGKSHE